MENSKSSKNYPVVPPTEQKCVWMTGGILSYQLCERQFDCDHCPLDSALRTFPLRTTEAEPIFATVRSNPAEKKKLSPGFLYSRKHCWVKPNEGAKVRIGLEPHLASMLLGAKTVVLPSVGDKVQTNKVCAWIVLEGGTLPIVAPLDGEVCRTNGLLVDQPRDIRDEPFAQGWLFEVTTSEEIFNLSFLFRMGEANRIYADDENRFLTLVNAEMKKHHSATGATLPDGGQPVKDVASMLGPDKFFRLMLEVYS